MKTCRNNAENEVLAEGLVTTGGQERFKSKGLRVPIAGPICLLLVGLASFGLYQGRELAVLIGFLLFVLPTIISSALSLARWSSPRVPLAMIKWTLIAALPIVPVLAVWHLSRPPGESLLMGLGALTIVTLAWFPQVAVALVYFHVPMKSGLRLARQFSLRTSMMGVTLLSVVLAGVGFYVKSSWGLQYRLERITRFDPDDWPVQPGVGADEKRSQEHRISQLLIDRIATSLAARDYRAVPLPADLATSPGVDIANESGLDYEWRCYTRHLPDDEQVYVLLEILNGKLITVESGTAHFGWRNKRSHPSAPATQAEHDVVFDFLWSLQSSIWHRTRTNPTPLAGAENRIQQITIPEPLSPPRE